MPSFDVVSEVDKHELANALDQANREVGNRFDFKGTGSKYELEELQVTLHSQSDFQLKQMLDILQDKLTRRSIDITCLKIDEPEIFGREARQRVTVREGLEAPLAKEVVKLIKDSKLKVQAAIQGDSVRVTGKKRDDLQDAIALLRKSKLELPLQFKNFRD
jgi:hypothetical protein